MHISDTKLKELLAASGLVAEAEYNSAKEEAMRLGQTIANVLIGRGDVTEDYLRELVEPYFGVPVVDLKQVPIPSEVLESIPEHYAKQKNLAVFEMDKERGAVKVAMLDPFDYEAVEYLRAKLGTWVEQYLTTPTSLKFALKQYKKKIGLEFNQVIAENVKKFLSASGETDIAKMAEAVPIVTILDSIIDHGIALNASDIHFEPTPKEVIVRYRVDGILHDALTLHVIIAPILVARVKILGNMQIDEHRIPQDGRFRFEIEEGSNIDVRVNVMPVMHGEKVEMRLLKSSARPYTLAELGLPQEGVDIVMEEAKRPHGMILVTGPTGHGKTTTLYSILHILNTPEVNITTIEDPIEYEVNRINQTQVNVKAGITFANGLRALLRQNPDIIMVGEIRDNETVDIALHAALTGHLLLSSLHTNDAPSALPRLIDMGAPAFLLASTVNLVVAQRLVRKICSSCVESYKATAEAKKIITSQIAFLNEKHIKSIPQTLFRGKGCKVCGQSGYAGQIGIFELFRVTDPIRELVLKLAPAGEIRKQAIQEGMTTMFEDGLNKVESGVTTFDEVLRVVHE